MEMLRFMEIGGKLVNLLQVGVIEPVDREAASEDRNDMDQFARMLGIPVAALPCVDADKLAAQKDPDNWVRVKPTCGPAFYLNESYDSVRDKITATRMGFE
jgi:hypothetical protein